MLWCWLLAGSAALLAWARSTASAAARLTLRVACRRTPALLPPATVIVPGERRRPGAARKPGGRAGGARLSGLRADRGRAVRRRYSRRGVSARAKVVLAHGGAPEASEKVQTSRPPWQPRGDPSTIYAFCRFRRARHRGLAARPGRAARGARRRRIHRLSLVHARTGRASGACCARFGTARRVACSGPATTPRLGRRDGHSQGSVSSPPGVPECWRTAISDD